MLLNMQSINWNIEMDIFWKLLTGSRQTQWDNNGKLFDLLIVTKCMPFYQNILRRMLKTLFLSKHLVSSFYWSGMSVSNKKKVYTKGPQGDLYIYMYYWSLKMQPESNVNNFTQLGNKHSCQKNYVKLHKPFLKRVCFKETKYGLSYFRLFFFF